MADVVPISGTHPTNGNATPQRAVKQCLKHDENNHGIALTMPFRISISCASQNLLSNLRASAQNPTLSTSLGAMSALCSKQVYH